jgi:hypothetical protein
VARDGHQNINIGMHRCERFRVKEKKPKAPRKAARTSKRLTEKAQTIETAQPTREI